MKKITLTSEGHLVLIEAPEKPAKICDPAPTRCREEAMQNIRCECSVEWSWYDQALTHAIENPIAEFKDVGISEPLKGYCEVMFPSGFTMTLKIGELYDIPENYTAEIVPQCLDKQAMQVGCWCSFRIEGEECKKCEKVCVLKPLKQEWTDNMTKNQALEAMANGHKVAHRYFSDNEWMRLSEDKRFELEDGVKVEQSLFWADRRSKEWETDWRIVEPVNPVRQKSGAIKLLKWALMICNDIQKTKTYGTRFPETASLAIEIQNFLDQPIPPKRDEDEFYRFLLMEIIDYERLRDGFKPHTAQHTAYSLMVTELIKIKNVYITT